MQPRESLQNVHQIQNPRALPVESGISDTSIGASPRYVDEESCYLLADATRRVTTEICVSIQALEHDQHQVSMKFSRDQRHPGSCSCAARLWMHVITDHLAWHQCGFSENSQSQSANRDEQRAMLSVESNSASDPSMHSADLVYWPLYATARTDSESRARRPGVYLDFTPPFCVHELQPPCR